MAQTVFTERMRAGVAGAIVNEEPKRLISRNLEDAAGLAFGKGVGQGATADGCTGVGFTKLLGVAVRQRNVAPDVLSGNGYAKYDSVQIMTEGVIWVLASVVVTAGGPVTYDPATGLWSNTGGVAVTNARWDSTTTAINQIAKLRLATLHG